MRHLYAYRVTYVIAALIVAGAMLFAWLRSHDVPPGQDDEQGTRGVAVAQALGVLPSDALGRT